MPVVVGTYITATPQMITATEEALERELLRRALSQGAVPNAASAVVRDLMPSDLADADDVENTNSSTAWGLVDSGSLNDKKLIGIFGVSNLVQPPVPVWVSGVPLSIRAVDASGTFAGMIVEYPNGVAGVRFKLGASGAKTKDIWNLQGKGIERGKIVLAKAPIVYNKSETFNLDVIAIASGAVAQWHGKVVEPKGEKLSPD